MSKKVGPRSTPTEVRIQRAAKASRSMMNRQRLQLMLKAGLVTPEQAEGAAKLETDGKPE
jgi:hypothetical protein